MIDKQNECLLNNKTRKITHNKLLESVWDYLLLPHSFQDHIDEQQNQEVFTLNPLPPPHPNPQLSKKMNTFFDPHTNQTSTTALPRNQRFFLESLPLKTNKPLEHNLPTTPSHSKPLKTNKPLEHNPLNHVASSKTNNALATIRTKRLLTLKIPKTNNAVAIIPAKQTRPRKIIFPNHPLTTKFLKQTRRRCFVDSNQLNIHRSFETDHENKQSEGAR